MPQDFSYQNLQGRSFKGQDLTGANFSHSDIRGANFTNAILRNSKFINAKAGLQRRWVVGLVIGSLLLAALSGFTSACVGGIAGICLSWGKISTNQPQGIFVSLACIITLATFYIVTIRKGLLAAIETILWAMALIVTVYAAAALVVAIAVVVTAAGSAMEQAWAKAGTVGGTVVAVGTVALQLATFVILVAVRPLAVAVAWTVAGSAGGTVVAVGAVVGAVVGGASIVLPVLILATLTIEPMGSIGSSKPTEPADLMPVVLALVGTVTSTVAMSRLSAYVRQQFLAGDKKHTFFWRVAITLAAMGGTKFRSADLTDADFTQARLKNTDFRKANLTRTCWFQAQRLDYVHFRESYLAFQRPISDPTINVSVQQNRDE